MDAIKHTKKRLRVGMDYQPYLICRALWRDADIIPHLNTINRKPLPVYNCDTREQRLFEKQMHIDYLLSVASRKPIKGLPLTPP